MPSLFPDLTDALNKLYNKPRNGVHVSDLVNCARLASFRRKYPQKTTMRELNFFTLGKSLHQAAQDLVDGFPDVYVKEQEVWLRANGGESVFLPTELNGMPRKREEWMTANKINKNLDAVAHIDVYNKRDNIPVEMKGIRLKDISTPKSFHIQQLKYYMVMVDSLDGILLYQLLLHYDDEPFKEFTVHMTRNELDDEREKLLSEREKFANSVLQSDPFLATPVWHNPEMFKFKCVNCPWFEDCRKRETGK